MRALSTNELLSVWDHTCGQPGPHAALALLAAACPERSQEELTRLSIGERDALLLALRESLFGSTFDALTTCPSCAQRISLSLNAEEIRAAAGSRPSGEATRGEDTRMMSVDSDGYKVRFRLPDSTDQAAIESLKNPREARDLLLRRCVVSVEKDSPAAPRGDDHTTPAAPTLPDAPRLPESVVECVARKMARIDPHTGFRLGLNCPDCGHEWEQAFDIVPYLMTEIDAWARRIFREVHGLATAYGWSETEILAMNPSRRSIYLNLAAHRRPIRSSERG